MTLARTPLALALIQLTRNRAASTRLVLLLTLAVALGLFAQTFGATLALNQLASFTYSSFSWSTGNLTLGGLTDIDDLLRGAAAGFSHYAFVRMTESDPAFDGTCEIFLPQVRLVVARQAASEGKLFMCIKCKSEQAHHHAFVGF